MKTDYHIHTEFSCDSETKMEEYVKQALARDIRMLCFTDHVDLNPEDYGYNYYIYAPALSSENPICMRIP